MSECPDVSQRLLSVRACSIAFALALAGSLSACGQQSASSPTQVAAKVGKQEISVHQVNFLLKRQAQVPAAQQEKLRREALERLIDQELALAKAQEIKLDREPEIIQALDAARREIIARAYIDRMTSAAPRPSAEEVKKYHDSHPEMFAQRKVYDLQEVNVQASSEQLVPFAARLKAVKSPDEASNLLRAAGLNVQVRSSSVGPETVPTALFERIAALQPGQPMVLNAVGGAKVVFVEGSRSAPVDEASALPKIADYLHNSRKRELMEQELKSLRAATKVEYTGPFASLSAAASSPVAAPAVAPMDTGAPAASSALDAETINRGLK